MSETHVLVQLHDIYLLSIFFNTKKMTCEQPRTVVSHTYYVVGSMYIVYITNDAKAKKMHKKVPI